MKSTAILCAIAASLAFGSLAQAQTSSDPMKAWEEQNPTARNPFNGNAPYYQQRRAYSEAQGQQGQQAQQRQVDRAHAAQQALEDQRQWQRSRDWRESRNWNREQWAQAHDWRVQQGYPRYYRGDYVPYEYRDRRFYVNDWRAHRLAAPPRGYQWVETDTGDYLLMALATGLIANLVLNSR